jgi:hypothetical protein
MRYHGLVVHITVVRAVACAAILVSLAPAIHAQEKKVLSVVQNGEWALVTPGAPNKAFHSTKLDSREGWVIQLPADQSESRTDCERYKLQLVRYVRAKYQECLRCTPSGHSCELWRATLAQYENGKCEKSDGGPAFFVRRHFFPELKCSGR